MHFLFFAVVLLLSSALLPTFALDNGLGRTPPIGFNSWTAFGTGVNEAALRATADFFVSSGLKAAGYLYINSDDGYITYNRDNVTHQLVADPIKFPSGIAALSSYIHSKGLLFGLYTASSSVVCSGRPGSLYFEDIDAQTFASWEVDYIKIDLCGEYGFGNQARYTAFADAMNRTGRPMFISTEPYDITPNPSAATFSNMWRCCVDIDARYDSIIDRIDRNDVLAPLVGPGAWSDADMLQIGNGGLTSAEQRTHFVLWAITKNPLFLATDITKLSAEQLTLITNAGLIAINQDPLGIPARKLLINGVPPLRHVGLAPCDSAANTAPRLNGVTGASLVWNVIPMAPVNGTPAFSISNLATGRCLALAPYASVSLRPVLQPCTVADATQAWTLPSGIGHLGALVSLSAVGADGGALALAPASSTLYAALHGDDTTYVSDAAYGITNLTLVPWQPEPPCSSRNCKDYAPSQTWLWSSRSGLLALAVMSANHYRCFDGPCETGTTVVPTTVALCLSHVLSVAYAGTDPSGTSVADVWGGALAGNAYVLGIHNRADVPANVSAPWSALTGIPANTSFCVHDLFAGTAYGPVSGGVTLALTAHDTAALRLTSPPCA
jgi:alpha-galactosidase